MGYGRLAGRVSLPTQYTVDVEVTTNVPEDSVMHGQQDVDPKKVWPIQTGEFLRKVRLAATFGTQRGSNCSLDGIDTADQSWYPRRPGIFYQLLYDEWVTGSLSGPLLWDDRVEGGARGGDVVSLQHTAAAGWKHRNVSFVEQALANAQGLRGGRR